MPRGKAYTRKNMEEIMAAYNGGMPISEIAEITGRSPKGIANFVSRMKKKKLISKPDSGRVIIAEGIREKQLGDFAYEDIIRYMYKSGFRIEDNKLVHYTKTPIKIENLI